MFLNGKEFVSVKEKEMDIKSPQERSQNMSMIKSTCTKPEIFIRSLLHKTGLRFRVNYSSIVGKPDIYFTKKRVAVFINGCYWHRHKDCKYAYTPKSNTDFWSKKFIANQQRDRFVKEQLAQDGVRVLLIWECNVKKMMVDENICKELKTDIIHFIISPNIQYKEI